MRNVTILISNRCNLRCTHCMSNSGLAAESEPVVREQELLLTRLHELGTERIVVSGGEPLLRKQDVCDFLDAAARRGMTTGLLTNGLLLDETTVADLIRFRLGRVAVSIYSTDVSGLNSGRQSHYLRRLHRGLCALESGGLPYLISIPTHAGNIPETLEAVKAVAAMGLHPSRIRLLFISPAGRGNGLATIARASDWDALARECTRLRIDLGLDAPISISSFGRAAIGFENGCPIRHMDPENPTQLADPHVTESGDLYFCGLLVRDPSHRVANLLSQSLEAIHNQIRQAAASMAQSVGSHRCPLATHPAPAPCVLHEVIVP